MTASFVSSSLKIVRLIFIWPPDSQQGHWPWHKHLEAPNLSDLDDTDEVDAELCLLSNPQPGEGEGDGVGLPITLITHSLNLGLTVVPKLVLGVV